MSPVPVGPYYPTNGLVAQAWLGQRVRGLTPSMVASRLPRDPAAWEDEGFVQVTPITGAPNVDIPVRRPLVQVDCWANVGGSKVPPVGRANRLAELIRVATEASDQRYSSPVEMPTNYEGATVLSAYLLSEPVEVPDDPSGYARVTFDLMVEWVRR